MYRLIKPFLLMAFSFLIITACYNPVTQKTDPSTEHLVTPSECRVVQHKLGETCIPVEPQRIIALDAPYLADPLINIGIKPIGIAFYHGSGGNIFRSGLSVDEVEGIENVGDPSIVSLEKIILLKPDLILGLDIFHENIYSQLSSIAPTTIVTYDRTFNSFKRNFRHIAQIFDREEVAEVVLAQYQNRIKKLQERLGDKLEKITIATILYEQGIFYSMADLSTYAQIFSDIGLRHKTKPYLRNMFSIEKIHEYDVDILFIINSDHESPSFYLENPLISSLKVVQNNQAYVVDPDIWQGNGLSSVNQILDDLFKYLPKGE